MAKDKHAAAAKGRRSRPSTPKTDAQADTGGSSIPEQLQQHILNIFKDAFFQDEAFELEKIVQKVKSHLYDRDFATAFGSDDNLVAYAARWSSYRALAYLQIFQDISPHVLESSRASGVTETNETGEAAGYTSKLAPSDTTRTIETGVGALRLTGSDDAPAYEPNGEAPAYEQPPSYGTSATARPSGEDASQASMTITCLGGGAGAELVATAAWLRLQSETAEEASSDVYGQAEVEDNSLGVHCIDIADWGTVVDKLDQAIKIPPTISKYASAALKAANVALLPADAMRARFVRHDVLEASPDSMRTLFQQSDMITLMFTLNELYSTSVSKTQRLLFELTVAALPGTLLLVVDSPGSYSTVKLNNTEKKYPMQWLLDHTLLEASKNTRILARGDHWEKLVTDEARWFRVPKGLRYPIELENMRYQIHLYRRLEVVDSGAPADPSASRRRQS